jgi:hypothetical protein
LIGGDLQKTTAGPDLKFFKKNEKRVENQKDIEYHAT